MPSKTTPTNAFTLKANAGNKLRVLVTPVEFTLPSDEVNKKKMSGNLGHRRHKHGYFPEHSGFIKSEANYIHLR